MTTPAPPTTRPHRIVIAGAGFGGVRAALQLCRGNGYELTVISPDDSFAYYPQLYHSATGGARSESALPLSELFAGCAISVVQAKVANVDPAAQTITTDNGQSYTYDKLILALGSVTNYFGIEGLAEFSFDIKSITGAERFKRHLHTQLTEEQRTDVNYVVVGGGPTGIELASALGEYLERIVRLHGVAKPRYDISLIEAAPRLLPRSPENYAAKIQHRLEKLGVRVMTGTAVEAETATALKVGGKELKTQTVIWTAGVANNPFYKANQQHFTLAKNGKVEVNEYLEAAPNLYVIGDNAATVYSGMAQTAIADANFVARDIMRQTAQQPRQAYRPKAPISVIPVGSHWAAVQWGNVRLYGYLGWILRRLADLDAYSTIEHWTKALGIWLTDSRREDSCGTCDPHN